MNLDNITPQCFIMALFIRDDNERFLLGAGAYQFNQNQMHFIANVYQNDTVEVQGNDGIMLAGQVRRSSTQPFDGYIGDASIAKTDVEAYRQAFFTFFRKNFYYKVVYIMPDGTAVKRQKGFIVDAPEVKEFWQFYPKYHIALNFEDVNYYSYAEDSDGNEIYGKSATIPISIGAQDGGVVWLTSEPGKGAEWIAWNYSQKGLRWQETTGSGYATVAVASIDNVYPILEITGPAINPQVADLTTNITINYSGTVASGQKLVIDMNAKTALLNGTSVISNISGEWIYLKPGNNKITYTTDNNATAVSATMRWQEVLG